MEMAIHPIFALILSGNLINRSCKVILVRREQETVIGSTRHLFTTPVITTNMTSQPLFSNMMELMSTVKMIETINVQRMSPIINLSYFQRLFSQWIFVVKVP